MKKIRVLMCGSSRKEKGGMNSVIEQLMEHKWVEQVELSYLATHVTGNSIKKIIYFILAYLKLYYLIARNKFDIIHIHMSYKGSFTRKYIVASLCKKKNKKVILHLHGSEFKDFYLKGNNKLKAQIVELFTIVDRAILLGDEWENFILSIVPNCKTVVINNAVPIPKFRKVCSSGENRFLFMGALIKRKGVEDLILASKKLFDIGIKNFVVYIAGSGEEEKNLKNLSESNGLTRNINFLGWIDGSKKEELLQSADILVLPSYNEGLPISILEAMSYGLPIISTNVGSIHEAVHDGNNGFLIEPGDVDALSSSMKKYIENGTVWRSASLSSRKIVVDKFSEKTFFDKVLQQYIEVSKI